MVDVLTQEDALREISGPNGILTTSGWISSFVSRLSVDAKGDPIPWYTHAATAFLSDRLTPEMNVYEFGSGYSTLWYARKVKSVFCVEHNPKWADKLRPTIPGNVTYTLKPEGAYAEDILLYPAIFDVVVVDGAERLNCGKSAPDRLSPGGVIVWDNSTNSDCSIGAVHLRAAGFRRIDFYGLTPICTYRNCTSIFYRDNNCLGI